MSGRNDIIGPFDKKEFMTKGGGVVLGLFNDIVTGSERISNRKTDVKFAIVQLILRSYLAFI